MQRLHLLPVLLAVFLLTGCGSKPYDDAVTADALTDAAASTGEILAALSFQVEGETLTAYCAVPGSRELAETLAADTWTVTETEPSGDPGVTLRFADGWILALYPEGGIFYNTYAAPDTRDRCCYRIPETVFPAVSDFLAENGTPHSFGDGSIAAGTFSHS